MKSPGHLVIDSVPLGPGEEWGEAGGAWLFLHVTRGAAYWLGGEHARSLNEGEMLILPPKVKGAVRASQIGPVVLHTVSFAPDLLCGFFTLDERHFFENTAGSAGQLQFLPTTHPATRQFAALVGQGAQRPTLARRLEVLSLVAAVFDQEITRHRSAPPLGATAAARFKQLIAEMPDTEMINHSPDRLAHLCGCSPRHFNRLFRQHFGVSARQRQTELRLLRARQLLATSDAKIMQVALESGYRNLSLFNFLFKRRFGATPSAWRRKAASPGPAKPGQSPPN
jgi:AraC-like DNA-binding protein